jgi:hypothetical protein
VEPELRRGRLECGGGEFGLDRNHRGAGDHDNQRAGETPFGLATWRVAGEHVAMGEEGVDEVGGIEQQKNDGDAEAQAFVDQRDVHPACGCAFGEVEHRRQQNGDDHQEQQCRQQSGARLVEGLPSAPDAADERGDA